MSYPSSHLYFKTLYFLIFDKCNYFDSYRQLFSPKKSVCCFGCLGFCDDSVLLAVYNSYISIYLEGILPVHIWSLSLIRHFSIRTSVGGNPTCDISIAAFSEPCTYTVNAASLATGTECLRLPLLYCNGHHKPKISQQAVDQWPVVQQTSLSWMSILVHVGLQTCRLVPQLSGLLNSKTPGSISDVL